MGKTSYLFNDYIKDVTSVPNLVNEDANFLVQNSQDEQIALTTRTTDKVNILYQITLDATAQLQAFFIGNHNFSGGSVKIYSYTNADFVTGQNLEATVAIRSLDIYHRISSAPTTKTYWELDFTKNGSVTSSDSYLEFGRVMVYGDLIQLTDIPDWITKRGLRFKNIINKTSYGVRWVHKLTEKIERFELGWKERTVSNAIHTELRALYEAVYGDAHPFLFIPDISNADCYYVYIEDPELLYTEMFGIGASAHVGSFRLRLIEAVRGKV